MSGVRFVFYLDGKKMTVWTLISNRMVNLKSGMGAEAVSDIFPHYHKYLRKKWEAETNKYAATLWPPPLYNIYR